MSEDTRTGPQRVREHRPRPFVIEVGIRLVREKPLATAGGIIVLLMLLVGIFADFLAPYGMDETILSDRLQGPSAAHPLGTDNVGRDELSRIIYGARVSVIVGLLGSALCTIIALLIGGVSGFFGGKFDMVVQRFVDAQMCIPGLFLLLTVMSVVGPGIWQVIIVLGIMFGFSQSRVVRSAVIGIKGNAYIEAASAIGASTPRVLVRHVLPNVMAPVIIIFTVSMGAMVLTEASISFLGLGIPPPDASWGYMLSASGRQYMLQAPWMALWPGLALALAIYGSVCSGTA